jgi:hypothetical protein
MRFRIVTRRRGRDVVLADLEIELFPALFMEREKERERGVH